MPDNDLSQIDCVLFEPETNVRYLLLDALGRLRIQNLQVFGHMEDVWKAFQGSNPDLLIADATSPDSETFKLVQSVRHSVVGGNPFLGIIITAFSPTAALLTKVTNCGADALPGQTGGFPADPGPYHRADRSATQLRGDQRLHRTRPPEVAA